jgi:DNA replication and repair protein RecF
MLTLKLSEVDWLRERTGTWPVLLLDEVLAELDPAHRESLLARVHSVHQAILTASDLAMFSGEFQRQARIWKVASGTVGAA